MAQMHIYNSGRDTLDSTYFIIYNCEGGLLVKESFPYESSVSKLNSDNG